MLSKCLTYFTCLSHQGRSDGQGEKSNAHRILVGKPEGKSLLGGQIRRWMDNIIMGVRGTEWGGMD
jgi:hypothetical protein